MKKPISLLLMLVLASLLTTGAASAAFPGGNGRIAYERWDGSDYEIFTMNPDGSDQLRLTENTAADSESAWSPDGGRLAFVSDRSGRNEVYVTNANGSDTRRLTFNGGTTPSWSPSGKRLAFDRRGDLYTIGVSDRQVRRVTRSRPACELDPAWSPDGRKIAFTLRARSCDGASDGVFKISPDGGGQQRLTGRKGTTTIDNYPNWAPGGRRIVFRRFFRGGVDIWRVNADGSGEKRLIELIDGDFGSSQGDPYPAYSPDGTRIVFDGFVEDPVFAGEGESGMFVMNADGRGLERILNTGSNPDWQPVP